MNTNQKSSKWKRIVPDTVRKDEAGSGSVWHGWKGPSTSYVGVNRSTPVAKVERENVRYDEHGFASVRSKWYVI